MVDAAHESDARDYQNKSNSPELRNSDVTRPTHTNPPTSVPRSEPTADGAFATPASVEPLGPPALPASTKRRRSDTNEEGGGEKRRQHLSRNSDDLSSCSTLTSLSTGAGSPAPVDPRGAAAGQTVAAADSASPAGSDTQGQDAYTGIASYQDLVDRIETVVSNANSNFNTAFSLQEEFEVQQEQEDLHDDLDDHLTTAESSMDSANSILTDVNSLKSQFNTVEQKQIKWGETTAACWNEIAAVSGRCSEWVKKSNPEVQYALEGKALSLLSTLVSAREFWRKEYVDAKRESSELEARRKAKTEQVIALEERISEEGSRGDCLKAIFKANLG